MIRIHILEERYRYSVLPSDKNDELTLRILWAPDPKTTNVSLEHLSSLRRWHVMQEVLAFVYALDNLQLLLEGPPKKDKTVNRYACRVSIFRTMSSYRRSPGWNEASFSDHR